ncbi:hypothetical protein [Cesiribacter andamanensis]|uniref:ATP-binding protein n=1 Tax=Cesiribacter andamanensis AMV16 TaxID=1279009 RepID=M7NR81_9BACT|nr:hypothetical protein [Cesiribacter andamanensis]EMR01024.1 hypothetical protein ADICEAN_03856 [Cesiribacter andamanensis AMV16]
MQLGLPARVQTLKDPFQEVLASLPAQSTLNQLPEGAEAGPLPPDRLVTFNPRELAGLELLPQTVRSLTQKSNEVRQQLEEIRQRLGEVPEAALYKLTEAQAFLEQQPGQEEQARSIALEGIDHARQQINALGDRLQQLTTTIWQELEQLVVQMSNHLLQLSNPEMAISLQQHLQRKKSRKQKAAEQKRNSLSNTPLRRLQARLQQRLKTAGQEQHRFWAQLGLEEPLASSPSAPALPDYLAEKEQALQRLPFVYQRLFTPEPLPDELLLVGRTAERHELQEASRRWQQGVFSSLLLVGEGGSGSSSLLSLFAKKLPPDTPLARLPLQAGIDNRVALARQLAPLLGLPEHTAWEALQAWLRQPPAPQVVVVEDIQYLFRRWMGGLALMHDFLDLVAGSSRQVLWLCSCSLYAWKYLHRTLEDAQAWSRVVELQPFSQAELRELIMRRHLLSGYQLQYEPGPQEQRQPISSLPAEEKQALLEETLFTNMHRFAQGSLRLALLYWQWSAVAVSKTTITLRASLPGEPVLPEQLQPNSYFMLQALLLHGQLTAPELCRILNQPERHCRSQLQLLHKLQLILEQGSGYTLNPLLYRLVVTVLKQKNLLH